MGFERQQIADQGSGALRVGAADDAFEREADRVADAVIRGGTAPWGGMRGGSGVQRKCAGCKEEENEGVVQREATGMEAGGWSAPPIVGEVLRSGGRPLDAEVRAYMEPRFGHDFSSVRVHDDARAAESARAVNANAYTVGSDVVFGEGRYMPGSGEGRRLVAHELTHVVQASPATLRRSPDSPSACDAAHEEVLDEAATTARQWVATTRQWFEDHLQRIRRRALMANERSVSIGARLYRDFLALEGNFIVSQEIRRFGGRSPIGAEDSLMFDDYVAFGSSTNGIRSRFERVDLSISRLCQEQCPAGRTEGSEWLGSAVPGSHEATFYTNCFDLQGKNTKAGVFLHEAFHASFSEFDHDTYSFEGDYPGSQPRTNAESYAVFASERATGGSFHIRELPAQVITVPVPQERR